MSHWPLNEVRLIPLKFTSTSINLNSILLWHPSNSILYINLLSRKLESFLIKTLWDLFYCTCWESTRHLIRDIHTAMPTRSLSKIGSGRHCNWKIKDKFLLYTHLFMYFTIRLLRRNFATSSSTIRDTRIVRPCPITENVASALTGCSDEKKTYIVWCIWFVLFQ